MTRTLTITAALVLLACTDAGLQPVAPPPVERTDDRLRIVGEVCTEPADVTPFPVKILFLLDQSASLQCTDPNNRRFAALRRVVDGLTPLPNVQFGFVGFASWSRKQAFTRDLDAINRFLDPGQGLGPATDYQGALASAVEILERDMREAGAAIRARTRYVVVFVSDGSPEPRCRPGCEDDRARCGNGVDDDGDGLTDGADPDCDDLGDASLRPDVLYGVCNTDLEVPEDVYVDYPGRCPEYNMPRQITQRVDDLRALERIYAAGDVTLHTVFLASPQEVVEGVCPGASQSFGYNGELARALLEGMADAGGGSFRDVNVDEDEGFLDFDYAALRAPFLATAFAAFNQNALAGPVGPVPDSDGDGLADDFEGPNGLDRHGIDTDGDGYGDRFEDAFRRAGFDPRDPGLPALPCGAPEDTDGDGASDCEEAFLGTDPRLPDSDGDRMVDGVELRLGTDPLVADGDADPDFDGVVNRDELRAGTDPAVADADRFAREAVRTRLDDLGERPVPDRETGEPEARRCYRFDVADLRLAVTTDPRERGRNRVLLDVLGEPVGLSGNRAVARRGCVEASYPGPGARLPASGVVDVTASAWDDLRIELERRLIGIAGCLGIEPLALDRPRLEEVVDVCLPSRVALDGRLFEREDLIGLVRAYTDAGLAARFPRDPSDLFHPIEVFDAEAHCHKPWEIERLMGFLELIDAACAACPAVAPRDGGTDGASDGGIDGVMP